MDQCEEEAALVTLETNGSAQIPINLWPGLAALKVSKHCENCEGTTLFKSHVPLGLRDLQWWDAAHPLVTKAGAPPHRVLWVLVSQQRPCLPDKRAAGFLLLPTAAPVCVLPNHMALAMRLFLAGKPRGAPWDHPSAAVLPESVSIRLSCHNAARNRSCSTWRHNVVGSFHLTRSELF